MSGVHHYRSFPGNPMANNPGMVGEWQFAERHGERPETEFRLLSGQLNPRIGIIPEGQPNDARFHLQKRTQCLNQPWWHGSFIDQHTMQILPTTTKLLGSGHMGQLLSPTMEMEKSVDGGPRSHALKDKGPIQKNQSKKFRKFYLTFSLNAPMTCHKNANRNERKSLTDGPLSGAWLCTSPHSVGW